MCFSWGFVDWVDMDGDPATILDPNFLLGTHSSGWGISHRHVFPCYIPNFQMFLTRLHLIPSSWKTCLQPLPPSESKSIPHASSLSWAWGHRREITSSERKLWSGGNWLTVLSGSKVCAPLIDIRRTKYFLRSLWFILSNVVLITLFLANSVQLLLGWCLSYTKGTG